jgi:hypothetical protein
MSREEKDMAEDKEILDFLQRLGAALSAGQLKEVSSCWAVPAMVLTDDGAVLITDPSQIEQMFEPAVSAYKSSGISSTEPEILRIDRLTERLIATDVRWPYLDSDGNRHGAETSSYILWADGAGRLLLRVALSRTADPSPGG